MYTNTHARPYTYANTHKTRSAVAEAIGENRTEIRDLPITARIAGAVLGAVLEGAVRLYQRIAR